jgi:hypothetical protein
MEIDINLFRRNLFAVLLLFALAFPLQAQTAGYFLDTNSGEPRFIQRLAWSGGEYALRYEVLVEKLEGGKYISRIREFTAALFIDVSLPPGAYRFSVIPYDVLDRPGESSGWVTIEVLPALRPELYNVSQEPNYNDSRFYLFKLEGDNLLPGSEIYLRRQDGERVVPEVKNFEDGRAFLYFDRRQLIPGEYEIFVRNPGGLEAGISGISLAVPVKVGGTAAAKPVNINIGAGWMPVLPVYGESFGGRISVFGAEVRISTVFYIPDIYIGPEITGLLYYLNDPLGLRSLAVGGGIMVQKPMPSLRTAVNFRLGAEYVIPHGDNPIHANMGVSFLWKMIKNLFVEVGIDYTHLFNESTSGYLRPRLSIGYEF